MEEPVILVPLTAEQIWHLESAVFSACQEYCTGGCDCDELGSYMSSFLPDNYRPPLRVDPVVVERSGDLCVACSRPIVLSDSTVTTDHIDETGRRYRTYHAWCAPPDPDKANLTDV